MNYLKIIISSLLIFSIVTLRLPAHEQLKNAGGDTRVGGYEELDVNHLPEDAKKIDQFLREKHSDFENGRLVSASRQVVAGMNYRMVYSSSNGSKNWDIIVYKNLHGDLLENGYTMTETLPNGQTVKAIADPSSAFVEAPKIIATVSAAPSVTTNSNNAEYKQIDRTTIPNSIAPKILGRQ